jgi:hypothetical protein
LTGVGLGMELERGWAVMPIPRANDMASYLLSPYVGSEPCRLALDAAGGRHLLVPIGPEEKLLDSDGANLGAKIRTLVFDNRPGKFVDIFCLDPALHDEFDEVVMDVLEEVQESDFPGTSAIKCIERWRRLFRAAFVKRTPFEVQVGLFAELAVLRELRKTNAFTESMWTGPSRARHDFELIERCFEVKGMTTASKELTIHGLEQMDTHDNKKLDLLVVVLTPHERGQTVSELVNEIRATLDHDSVFNGLLAKVGFIPGSHEESFDVAEFLVAPISHQSPVLAPSRLIGGTLPIGLGSVTYSMSADLLREISTAQPLTSFAGTL